MEDTVKYCCEDLKRLMKNNLFLERVNVKPNVIYFNKHRKCRTYQKTVEIRNDDISPLYVTLTSDFPSALTYRTKETQLIEAQFFKTVDIFYEPSENFLKTERENQRYNIYIDLQHPKLTIELPVILYRKDPELIIPKKIFFSKCALNLTSYYAMVIYNPFRKDLLYDSKWVENSSKVKLLAEDNTFTGLTGTQIVFSVTPKGYCSIFDELNLFCEEAFRISFWNEVEPYEPFISNKDIHFSPVYFTFSADEEFHVCNESFEPIKIKWCRKEQKVCQAYDPDKMKEPKNMKRINDDFMISPKSAKLLPKSSLKVRATFIPKPNLSGVEIIDFMFQTYAYLAFSTNENIRMRISLSGLAKGPSIVLNFCFLELGSIVVGEKRCVRVKASNPSPIPGTIKFIGNDGEFGGVASCLPLFHTLDPGDEKQFVVGFYPSALGKFMEKILFKIENGRQLHMMISGVAEPIRLIPVPTTIDFGTVYICSLQKKDLTIRNPLSGPVIVTLSTENDGVQEPLIISNFQDFVDGLEFAEQDEPALRATEHQVFKQCNPTHNVHPGFDTDTVSSVTSSKEALERKQSSSSTLESSKSSGFIELVDNTDEFAKNVIELDRVKKMTASQHPDLSILQNVVGDLLKHKYFQPLAEMVDDQTRNTKLPSIPREYLFSPEPVIVQAFESVTVPVFVVPNKCGQGSVYLKLQATVVNNYEQGSSTSVPEIGDTISLPKQATITTMKLSHNCIVPELEITESFDVETGIDYPTHVEFPIRNLLNVAGIILMNFLYLLSGSKYSKIDFEWNFTGSAVRILLGVETADNVTNYTVVCDDHSANERTSSAEVVCTPRAIAIKSCESVICDVAVTTRVLGVIVLNGWVQIFGSARLYPFKMDCHTMPPRLKIHVTPIKYTGKALENDVCMTGIENLGNGLLQYTATMKHDTFIKCFTPTDSVEPNQCKEVRLLTSYVDPGAYKNVLYLDVKHLDVIEIPVHSIIYGLPLVFDPNLEPSLNLNKVPASAKPLETLIAIQNMGRRFYNVYLTKKKEKVKDENDFRPKFEFPTNLFQLAPQEIYKAKLVLSRRMAKVVSQDFSVDVVEKISRKRFPGFIFTAEVSIIASKLVWSRPMLEFEFRNSDFFETCYGENVTLKNKACIPENVTIEPVGSFQIYDATIHGFSSKLNFIMEPNTSREFDVCFNIKEVNRWNQDVNYEGKILLTTPEKKHKPLDLFCKILFPIITLPRETIQCYSLAPFSASFTLENPGEMLAFYQWSYDGAPLRQKVSLVKHCNFQTVWDRLAERQASDVFSLNIDKEWLISFKRFIECNLEDDVEDLELESLESVTVRSNKPSSKRSTAKDTSKDPGSAKSKGGDSKKKSTEKSVKSEKSSLKSDKTDKKSKTSKKSQSASKEEAEEPKPPEFICNESKLRVAIDEITCKLRKVFQIDGEKKSNLSARDINTVAKEFKDKIKPSPTTALYLTLDHYRGSIHSKAQKTINMFFSGDPEDVAIESTLKMDVLGGKSGKLLVKICNAPAAVEISPSSFDTGIQPWHKIGYFQVSIKNINPYPAQIVPAINEYQHQTQRQLSGYIDVFPQEEFVLAPGASGKFYAAVFIGLNQNFYETFGIEVNCGMPASVEFKGRALIPMISVLHVERLPPDNVSTEQEYVLLNRIYKEQIAEISVKEANVADIEIEEFKEEIGMFELEEMEMEQEKSARTGQPESSSTETSIECGAHLRVPLIKQIENQTHPSTTDFSTKKSICNPTYRKEGSDPETSQTTTANKLIITKSNQIEVASELHKPRYRAAVMQIADPELADFCVLDYPEEYPSSVTMHNLLEIDNFQRELSKKSFAWKGYVKILKKYVLEKMDVKYSVKPEKFLPPIRPASFRIQPLPFYTSSYRMNLGDVLIGKKRNWILELYFHGPGKVFFSVRTLLAIPGMKISILEPDFECEFENEEFKFSIYNNTLIPKANCKYRDMNSRSAEEILSMQDDCVGCVPYKICHAHSFDFNVLHLHTRDITKINRKLINEFYSWWNRPVKEVKDPYIHSEIYQERLARTDNKIFKIKIEFKPTAQCYDDPTTFEDYLYIDIHLGPTIPIILDGTISSSAESETSGSVDTESF